MFCLIFQVGLGVWGAGGQGCSPRGSRKKMRPSSPPSSPSVVWSQVSGRRVFPAHILWVDPDFIVHCRGTGEASVFSLTSLSSQTGPDMVGMYTHPSSSSQILVSPTAMFHSGMRWECDSPCLLGAWWTVTMMGGSMCLSSVLP